MRGELVEQDANDESVEVILEKIEEERQRLIDENKIRKQRSLPSIEKEELPYKLPRGWKWVRLGDIGEWKSGSTPSRSNSKYYNGNIPWLKTGELKDNFIYDSQEKISELALKETSLRLNKPGDVLIAMYGATIGKLGILKVEATTNQACCACTPFNGVYNKFLFYYLRSIRQILKSKAAGGAQPNISREKIVNTIFPLPPYSEQKRIVDKIDLLFNLCDNWEKEVEKQQKYLIALREKVLDDAMKGLLVEQDDNDEPAEVLVKKIEEEKQRLIKEKKIKKQQPHPIQHEEIPYEPLPNGWAWARINDVALINPRNKINDELEVGFVPMKLIQEGYSIEHDVEVRKWGEVKKGFTHFQENDVIVSKITPCFENRKSSIVKNLPNNYGAGTTELHVVRPFHKYILKEYLMIHFKSKRFIETGIENFSGTAGQQRINKDFISNYVIGIPPLNEQRRIVEKVKKLFAYIVELESQIILPK